MVEFIYKINKSIVFLLSLFTTSYLFYSYLVCINNNYHLNSEAQTPHGLDHSRACLCKYGSLPRRQFTSPRGMWSLLKHSALGVIDVWIGIIDV